MSNLLVGQHVGEDIFRIAAELRRDTMHGFEQNSGKAAYAYSPWMCLYPLTGASAIPDALLKEPTSQRGGLVTNLQYLESARAFMMPRKELTRNGIFDQKHEDWIAEPCVSPKQKSVFDAGRAKLMEASPLLARMYLELVDYVIPLGGQRNRGYSTHLTRGIVFRSIPDDADLYDVAIDLAHETGHYALIALQSLDKIMTSDLGMPVFSEIRRTLRPAIQTMHAAVALAFMHLFIESFPSDQACKQAGIRRGKKYTESVKRSLYLSIESLWRDCAFTLIGKRVMHEMEELL